LIFALIEFAYLFIVESGTLAYGSAMKPLWYTVSRVFKDLMLDAAVGVFLILMSVWIEQAGVFTSPPRLRRPVLRPPATKPRTAPTPAVANKCDVEW